MFAATLVLVNLLGWAVMIEGGQRTPSIHQSPVSPRAVKPIADVGNQFGATEDTEKSEKRSTPENVWLCESMAGYILLVYREPSDCELYGLADWPRE